MATAVAGNRMGFAMGMVLAVMGLALAMTTWDLTQTNWARPQVASISSIPRLDMTADVTPDPVAALDRVTIATTFRASEELREPLRAHLEIVGADVGIPVLAMSQSGFRIPAEGARAVYWEWRVPDNVPPGEYALRLRLVGVDSGKVYAEEERAATFTVDPRL